MFSKKGHTGVALDKLSGVVLGPGHKGSSTLGSNVLEGDDGGIR